MGNESFEYLIADIYDPSAEVPDGLVVKSIPAFTWAVFPCKGAFSQSMQAVNTQIFQNGFRLGGIMSSQRDIVSRCMMRRIIILTEPATGIIMRRYGFQSGKDSSHGLNGKEGGNTVKIN